MEILNFLKIFFKFQNFSFLKFFLFQVYKCVKYFFFWFRSGVGVAGALQTVYYVEVTDEQRVTRGGGSHEEGEVIEVVEIPVERARLMMFDESLARPAGFMFSLMWFFTFKYPDLSKTSGNPQWIYLSINQSINRSKCHTEDSCLLCPVKARSICCFT